MNTSFVVTNLITFGCPLYGVQFKDINLFETYIKEISIIVGMKNFMDALNISFY